MFNNAVIVVLIIPYRNVNCASMSSITTFEKVLIIPYRNVNENCDFGFAASKTVLIISYRNVNNRRKNKNNYSFRVLIIPYRNVNIEDSWISLKDYQCFNYTISECKRTNLHLFEILLKCFNYTISECKHNKRRLENTIEIVLIILYRNVNKGEKKLFVKVAPF